MLCDHCHKNEAVIHLKQIVDGEMRVLNLCAQCAAEAGKVMAQLEGFDFGSLPHEVAAVIAVEAAKKAAEIAMGSEPGEEEAEGDDHDSGGEPSSSPALRCPSCGMTAAMFRKTGRLGCAACYEAFATLIAPALAEMHRGVRHTGRTPESAAAEARNTPVERGRLYALEEELRRAVAAEAYEEAARIRDHIRRLQASLNGVASTAGKNADNS